MGINDYLAAIQRRWPVVVVAGLLGLIIGYLVAPGAANQLSGQASSYRDLMSYSHGSREDLIAMDVSQWPSLRMTVPTPADGGAEQNRAS